MRACMVKNTHIYILYVYMTDMLLEQRPLQSSPVLPRPSEQVYDEWVAILSTLGT